MKTEANKRIIASLPIHLDNQGLDSTQTLARIHAMNIQTNTVIQRREHFRGIPRKPVRPCFKTMKMAKKKLAHAAL